MQKLNFEEEESFGNLAFMARQIVEGFITGLHKSPFHGFSVEFAEHRPYNLGDNVKNIDWKLFAKTEKLYTKQYEEETNLRCQFVLDTSSSMYFPEEGPSKLQFALQSIAALMYLLKQQRDAFALSLFTHEVELHTQAKSTSAHLQYLMSRLQQLLEKPMPHQQTNFIDSLHYVAEQSHKRSLIVIFSDFISNDRSGDHWPAFFDALQHLKFNKHEVLLFNVLDKAKELDFKFENRPIEFVDLETRQKLRVSSNRIQTQYQQMMHAYFQELELKCMQYKIDMLSADIQEGYHPVLQRYLLKRQRMM